MDPGRRIGGQRGNGRGSSGQPTTVLVTHDLPTRSSAERHTRIGSSSPPVNIVCASCRPVVLWYGNKKQKSDAPDDFPPQSLVNNGPPYRRIWPGAAKITEWKTQLSLGSAASRLPSWLQGLAPDLEWAFAHRNFRHLGPDRTSAKESEAAGRESICRAQQTAKAIWCRQRGVVEG